MPPAAAVPLVCDGGEGLRLRLRLEEVLGIPKHARSFTVTFARGAVVVVSVEYIPHTLRKPANV